MKHVDWQGYTLVNASLEAVVEYISFLSKSPTFKWVTTLNTQMVMIADENEKLKKFIQSSAMITADGEGVIEAVRQENGIRLEKVPGIEITQTLIKEPLKLFFLGAKEVRLQKAIQAIKNDPLSQCKIVGFHHGYFDPNVFPDIIEKIKKLQPDVILVGMGCPNQETVLMTLSKELSKGVGMGVGGSFDILSGHIRRAPKWCQLLRLEWLYRCLREPSRLRSISFLWNFYKRYLS